MIIKMQPKEFEGKPLISEKDLRRSGPEVYMGRVIIEFWCEKEEGCEDPAFAWSVDHPEQPNERWHKLFLNGLKGATRHIEDTYRHRLRRV